MYPLAITFDATTCFLLSPLGSLQQRTGFVLELDLASSATRALPNLMAAARLLFSALVSAAFARSYSLISAVWSASLCRGVHPRQLMET